MRLVHFVLIGAIMFPGCTKKDSDDMPPMPSATTTAVAPTPEPLPLTTAEPAGPGEVVRPELDNRSDGTTGTPLTVAGAKATIQTPTDWKVTKTEAQVAAAADQKSRLAAASYGPEGPAAQLEKLAGASGLAGCTWGAPQSLTVGKDKLVTQAADGKCNRGGASVSAAYMAAEGLVVLGSWDEGADRNALFGSLRTVAKTKTGPGSPGALVACCRVLAQNAKSQPQPQQGFMMQAAATCEAAARANNVGGVNAALSQFGMKCN